ncbi:MAG TPA: hypothetical protein VIU11_04760 [Nakamurella sp.]
MTIRPTRYDRPPRTAELHDPAYQAFLLLRTAFTVAPIVFGLDKFFNLLTDWPGYLAPWIDSLVPGTAQQAMYVVGVVEIAAGILVALRPLIGGYVVAAWLAGIIVNLLLIPGFYDVALRDFGLLLAALALTRLAVGFRRSASGTARPEAVS